MEKRYLIEIIFASATLSLRVEVISLCPVYINIPFTTSQAQVLPGENVVVSQIATSPTGNHMAVGYVDGNISVFELTNNEVVCQFAGHKSAVTCLQYDEQGHRLVSGSKVSIYIDKNIAVEIIL